MCNSNFCSSQLRVFIYSGKFKRYENLIQREFIIMPGDRLFSVFDNFLHQHVCQGFKVSHNQTVSSPRPVSSGSVGWRASPPADEHVRWYSLSSIQIFISRSGILRYLYMGGQVCRTIWSNYVDAHKTGFTNVKITIFDSEIKEKTNSIIFLFLCTIILHTFQDTIFTNCLYSFQTQSTLCTWILTMTVIFPIILCSSFRCYEDNTLQ